MKKFLVLVVSIVSIFAIGILVTSCGVKDWANQLFCEHEFSEGEITKESTCFEEGEITKTCNLCGKTDVEKIDKVAHVVEQIASVVPTCDTVGYTSYTKCLVCEEILTDKQEIPAIGHVSEVISGYSATCLKDGLSDGLYCSTCNEILVEQTIVPAFGHTLVYSPEEKATCYKPGKTQGVSCSKCGEVFVEPQKTEGVHVFENHNCIYCGRLNSSSLESLDSVQLNEGENFHVGFYRLTPDSTAKLTLTSPDGTDSVIITVDNKGAFNITYILNNETKPSNVSYDRSIIDTKVTHSVDSDDTFVKLGDGPLVFNVYDGESESANIIDVFEIEITTDWTITEIEGTVSYLI